MKFHLGERRADGSWRTIDDRAEITAPRRGPRRVGTAAGRAGPTHRRGDRRDGVRGGARRRRGNRRGGHCRAADGAKPRRAHRRGARAVRRRGDGHRRRGGGPAGLRRGGAAVRARQRGPLSCSIPAAAARSSRSATAGGRRALQRERRRHALHGAIRARRARSTSTLAAALEAIAADLASARRAAVPERSLAWAARSRTSQPSSSDSSLRPRCGSGRGARRRRGRSPDRAVPHADGRAAARDRRPAAGASGGDTRRRVHRPHGSRKLGRESLTVSDRGLRHGLLVERFGQPRRERGAR